MIEYKSNLSQALFEIIVADFIKRSRPIAQKFAFRINDPEDLIHSAIADKLGRWLEQFERSKSRWSTFALNKFKFFCIDFLRQKKNNPTLCFRSRSGKSTVVAGSLNAPSAFDGFGDDRPKTLADTAAIERPTDIRSFELHEFVGSFPPRLRQIVRLRMGGKTNKEIGRLLDLSESRISQLLGQNKKYFLKELRNSGIVANGTS